MNKRVVLVFILVFLSVSFAIVIQPVKSQSSQGITINADGSVTPSNVAIQREGNTYTITADLSTSIIVEKGGIIIDGANHTLQGPGLNQNGIAVNLTATNVTVENMHIANWKTGILGAWNNNTVTNNDFTSNSQSIAIYADDYVVSQNSITNNAMALFIDGGGFRPQGDNNFIALNQIAGNNVAFDITNSNGTTITENNITNNGLILTLATNTGQSILYYNNFTNNKQILSIPFGGPFVEGIVPFSPAGQWDNGTVGNYWSDYLSTYPNAAEIGHSGIGNTPYMFSDSTSYEADYANGTVVTGIAVLGTAIDHYPLMAPILLTTFTLSAPPTASASQTPSQSPSSSSTPSSSIPEFPSWIILPLFLTASAVLMLILKKRVKRH